MSLDEKLLNLQSQVTELKCIVTELQSELTDLKLQKFEKERDYQYYLEKKYNSSHKKNKFGIVDIETETAIIEIKRWHLYKNAFGQINCYNSDGKKKKIVYFFGKKPKNVNDIVELFEKNNIEVFHIYKNGVEILEEQLSNPDETDKFYKWLSENIIYKNGEILKLQDICIKFLNKDVGPRIKTNYKKSIQEYIRNNICNANHLYQDSKYNNIKYKGWKNLCIRK